MWFIGQTRGAGYRDLEMHPESETPEIATMALQVRSARRRKMALAALMGVAALMCLLPASHAPSNSPRSRPAADAVALNEEGGISLQSINRDAAAQMAKVESEAKGVVAKSEEALDSHASKLKELKKTVKSTEADLERTLEDHAEGSKHAVESFEEKVHDSTSDLAKVAKETVKSAKETVTSAKADVEQKLQDSTSELAKEAEKQVEGAKAEVEQQVQDSTSALAKEAEKQVQGAKAEVEEEVKGSAAKLAAEEAKDVLGNVDGIEAVGKAKAYLDHDAERAHAHTSGNVEAANDYAATSVQHASAYADAVFDHAVGTYDSPCIENHVAYHPLDMKGQHISYEPEGINACIARCKKTEGCAHFTFFAADRSCHVADARAIALQKSAGAYAGTGECTPVVEKKMNASEHAAKSAELANAYAKQSTEAATVYNEGNVKRTQSYTQESLDNAKAFALKNVPELKALAEATAPEAQMPKGPETYVPMEKAEETVSSCFEENVAYHPLDMAGQYVSNEKDINACLNRCKDTEGCAYFTYFDAHKGCHITDAKATKAEHSVGAQAGTPECDAVMFKL